MNDDILTKRERIRESLEAKLKREFLRYIGDCKQQLELDRSQGDLQETLLSAARLLLRKVRADKTEEGEAK